MLTNRDVALRHDRDGYDEWAVEPIPVLDLVIPVAALVLAAAAIVGAATIAAEHQTGSVLLAIPALLAVLAPFTGRKYAYSSAIGLCLLFGLFGLFSDGVQAYLPLAGLPIAQFVRAEHRRGVSEPFSNGALGVMFVTTSPIGSYLLWLGDGAITRILEGW